MGTSFSPRVLAVIPARFASSRLPGKVLADLGGKPIVQHVHERVGSLPGLSEVLVATDDARVAEAVQGFGGVAVMTSPDCPSGTDRVALVARGRVADVVLNVQGDEPFIATTCIEDLVAAFADEGVRMATLSREAGPAELPDPNVVKVVCDLRGDALYFSRQAIPFGRNGAPPPVRAHVGVYAYRPDFLDLVSKLEPSPLERAEALEQLRVLENGHKIRVVPATHAGFGIDTADDLDRARRLFGGS